MNKEQTRQEKSAGAELAFTFEVAGDPPTFTYSPTTDWTYNADDTLYFETTSGPFKLDVIRKDATDLPGGTRPFPPLVSHLERGKHVTRTGITDGLTPEQRVALREEHATPTDTFGFIGRYRYKIEVTLPNNMIAFDDQKNGEYKC